MSDSDSDETPGAAGFFVPVSFDKIESFTEAFPFHQAAKVLSINDLQGNCVESLFVYIFVGRVPDTLQTPRAAIKEVPR